MLTFSLHFLSLHLVLSLAYQYRSMVQTAWGRSLMADSAAISIRPTLYAWNMKIFSVGVRGVRHADIGKSNDPYLIFQGQSLLKAKVLSNMCTYLFVKIVPGGPYVSFLC